MAAAAEGHFSYRPAVKVSGDMRLSGSSTDGALIRVPEAGFSKHHPGMRFAYSFHGPMPRNLVHRELQKLEK